jgi:hypothetical protein
MSAKLNKDRRVIQRYLNKLQKQGYVERVLMDHNVAWRLSEQIPNVNIATRELYGLFSDVLKTLNKKLGHKPSPIRSESRAELIDWFLQLKKIAHIPDPPEALRIAREVRALRNTVHPHLSG